jgi:hypothetical protein
MELLEAKKAECGRAQLHDREMNLLESVGR